VLVATGSFLGEGFDCPPLDTVFMAFPIAFREELSSTLAESCDPWMANHPLRFTITSTDRARYSPECTERDFQGTPLSVSTPVRIVRSATIPSSNSSVFEDRLNLNKRRVVACRSDRVSPIK